MRITKETYSLIPNGTTLYLFLEGDGWGENKGRVITVVKVGDWLVDEDESRWSIDKANDLNYEYSLIK